MGDNSNSVRTKFEKVRLESTVSRKNIAKKYKKSSKSVKRRNRRKRSKNTYLNMLRKERVHRTTQELCNSIQDFSVMDLQPMGDIRKLPEEVVEWHRKDQIAYWKSRAISFEIENKMLRQHLRDVYAQQIEYYEKSNNWQSLPSHIDSATEEYSNEKGKSSSRKKVSSSSEKVLPKQPLGKSRLQEMEKIYGEKAQQIMGMETVIELNYERLKEEGSPSYWPNIPLNFQE